MSKHKEYNKMIQKNNKLYYSTKNIRNALHNIYNYIIHQNSNNIQPAIRGRTLMSSISASMSHLTRSKCLCIT